ncbi:PQQ-binding-like beta-propeller repeat protein [Alphaproteobacteria bacterium GH1-50]|uniref:PQQ-binding-like beta-propeller repeat protein n=1 Tax=Kangsaoukella pontilimi TaxID=2691042 RepID=A0A7C9IGN0_9RHOB|nr:PQQ-binding-like beta-propeller repeat protein [Kangsaoukella pontilimi]MXQ07002.1 PQQ-binding-like beta-propeller repeat protein [Kangsaoukella pontilimi]
MNGLLKAFVAAGLVVLAGCGDEEIILEGPREALRPSQDQPETVNRTLPISLPPAVANADWDHKGGSQTHAIRHPALRQPLSLVWSADIGAGNSRGQRLTADPIVWSDRVFTLDSEAQVSAFDLSGSALWTTDLTPPGERRGEASGGGIAADGGRIFVTTGFGRVTALDPASGAVIWEQQLEAAATGAPMAADGVVYLTTRNAAGWAIDAATGRILWQVLGTPEERSLVGGPSPALSGELVIFPFASGQLVSAVRSTGGRAWIASVAGQRATRAFSRVRDLTGDPVVTGGRVYAGSHGGRTSAMDAASGTVLWTAEAGAMSPVWVDGGSVFLVSDRNRLIRLDAETGETIWSVELPFFAADRESRRKTAFAHYGPVLAGGRLVVLSDDGVIRNFDPASGALLSTDTLPDGAARNPVVAGGVLYVVTEDGRLHAFR